ncbi:MAG TPA: thioredoxin domain-containing protein [Candidatus Paceibacterota bacterium]|nr:thioredoxin domain-containing protein [Candidatus Paceibacterota bacterium]
MRPVSYVWLVTALVVAALTGLYFYQVRSGAMQNAADAIAPTIQARAIGADDHVRGQRDAETELIIYSDPECQYCQSFYRNTLPLLEERWGADTAITYRHYFLPRFIGSRDEAKAAECAGFIAGEWAFWEYLGRMFERNAPAGQSSDFRATAVQLGIEGDAFDQCMAGAAAEDRIQRDHIDGTLAQVTMTPSVLVRRGHRTVLVAGDYLQKVNAAIEYVRAAE